MIIYSTKTRLCPNCKKDFIDMFPHYRVKGQPVCSEKCWEEYEPKNSNLTEVIIKPEILDTSILKEEKNNKEYRPTSWNEYIGQNNAKEKVKTFIDGCQKFNDQFPHIFITAYSGMGKTSFTNILASQLNKKIIFTTGGELKSEQIFVDKLAECDGGIIFVDEANRLNKRVGFFILPLMEQFELHGKSIKKFSLFFATTHIGDLSKDLDALIQRCETIIFEDYKDYELLDILKQYNLKQYPKNIVDESILKEIVKNCRNIPRNAKNLLRAYVYSENWKQIKSANGIIKDGLTIQDVKTLKFLNSSNGIGKNSIANYLRVKPQTYEFEIEPYLIHKQLIEVGNRRKITLKGKDFLNEI